MNKNKSEQDAASKPDKTPATNRNPADDAKAVAPTTALAQEPRATAARSNAEDSDESQEPSTSPPERLTGNEKIPLLLLLLFPAGLRHSIAAIPQRIRFKMISFFGICSMIAPLALWIAPSMKVWLSILAGSLLSILFCWALVWFGPEDHF